MGSPAARASLPPTDCDLEFTGRVMAAYRRSQYLVPWSALVDLAAPELESGLARLTTVAARLRARSRPNARKGSQPPLAVRRKVDAHVAQFAPDRLIPITSERRAARWFALWLAESVKELHENDTPLSELTLLHDDEIRRTLGLAKRGEAFFDRYVSSETRESRWFINGHYLGGSSIRSMLRRRCEPMLAGHSWCREALNRTLGDPAVIDVIGASVPQNAARWCHSLLVDMPLEAPQELKGALFAQLRPSSQAAVRALFADSPHDASALWWPESIAAVHAAATWWMEQNAPQPALFDRDVPADSLREWFSTLAQLTRQDRSGFYNQRNLVRPSGGRSGVKLSADLIAATFGELARRCHLVSTYSGSYVGRASSGATPVFELSPAPTVALLSQRLGRELRHSDLAALPRWVRSAALPALPDPDAEVSLRVDVQRLTTLPELKRFAVEYALAHENRLPGKSQIRNLAEVEEHLGRTWSDLCSELIAAYPALQRPLSSYARDGIRVVTECFGAAVTPECCVAEFAPDAEDATLCHVDATLWLDDSSVLWFEFDGEGHFVHVVNWDLERARAGDRRRHRQLRAARTAGVDVTLVAFHHSVLPVSKGPLTTEILSEVIEWAELEGFKWLFLRPYGCAQERASEASEGEFVKARFGDVEVLATELVRPVRD